MERTAKKMFKYIRQMKDANEKGVEFQTFFDEYSATSDLPSIQILSTMDKLEKDGYVKYYFVDGEKTGFTLGYRGYHPSAVDWKEVRAWITLTIALTALGFSIFTWISDRSKTPTTAEQSQATTTMAAPTP